jgi:hypothetical protein
VGDEISPTFSKTQNPDGELETNVEAAALQRLNQELEERKKKRAFLKSLKVDDS